MIHTVAYLLLATALLFGISGCTLQRITKSKDIVYREANPATGTNAQHLNVFAPRAPSAPTEVLVFLYGGSWKSGKKELYSFLGKRFARRGITTVVIDYPLSPKAQYDEMATSAAQAVQWTKQHIDEHGGDPEKIFVSGHSAGGHLAALIALDNQYFDSLDTNNPVQGAILIDAAGLDMYGYLKEHEQDEDRKYLATFTKDPQQWKEATPLYHLHAHMPPLLIYQGEKTYPSIQKSTEAFVSALKNYVPDPDYRILPRKHHIPMITQFVFPWNTRYREMIRFMRSSGTVTGLTPSATERCY